MGYLTCIGDTTLNKIGTAAPVANKEASMLVSHSELSAGGRGASVAAMTAMLGVSTALLSTIGNDTDSKMLLSFLRSSGVNTACIRRSQGRSAQVDIYVDYRGRMHAMFFDPGATESLAQGGLTPREKNILASANIVFFTSVSNQLGLASLKAISETRQTVVGSIPSDLLTFRYDSNYIGQLLGRCEFLIMNKWEFSTLNARLRIGSGGTLVRNFPNIRALVVTRGALPTRVFSRTKGVQEIPVPRSRGANIVGAGDGFAAEFLAALVNESADILLCVRKGHSAAKQVVASTTAYANLR